MSSVSVLGAGIHEGLDGAAVELISLEKVTLIYTNPGCCYHYSFNGHSRISLAGLLVVVFFVRLLINQIFIKIFVLIYISYFVLLKINN